MIKIQRIQKKKYENLYNINKEAIYKLFNNYSILKIYYIKNEEKMRLIEIIKEKLI